MAEEREMINIYIMGKHYEVPAGLTIMKAMEYAGYRFIRGCGCRGGFCGACGTVYRKPGDFRLKVGLACQTMVEDGMYLTQIPFYPANKATYNLEELTPTLATMLQHYPEMTRCLGCNQCTRICPQELNVMNYIAAAQRGDIEKLAHMSFDCIMCGLCASRCPAEIVQYNVAILGRRLYGRHIAPRAQHLAKRVAEIQAGRFDAELDRLTKLSREELQNMYNARDIEP
ncbi:4Fe-4S dicluster domain-containing protein [Desulfofundulus thermobenzoicus]|uniref:4Fe-4S dicluster domain-containing protein n=1 Tax=Desulfofundulus thermobenzoicus TaxID=29376 RepID=A0A6N7IU26_9FIRM|nr:4Fe-4S dicluster domain-containing protein [Desulfofundulus thermobenzoicus]MQL53019.1 4Fe-4S dicluster domain-containing protein [Desulfofundulus thermobenzoicus]HHW42979.1 4Fe-4S dicluster domain-containing protein [Desulfotomaculum sp.]